MARPQKSMLMAYLLWLLLCGLGVHRMYLRRAMSGLFLALMSFLGIILLVIGATRVSPEYMMAGGTTLLAVCVWCVLDLFFIPGMVRQINEPDDGASYVSLGAVNMDPSFSATMAGAGQTRTDGHRKSALPEDYEMPWRKPREKPTVVRYRSED